MAKLYDQYLKAALFWDVILGLILISITHFYAKYYDLSVDNAGLENLISNMIGSSISLAGFILAALTIVITFRANVKMKIDSAKSTEPEETEPLRKADNGLELILASKHYFGIIRIFRKSIIELVLASALLYLIWGLKDLNQVWLTPIRVLYAIEYSILAIALSTFRSLHILFTIMRLEKSQEEET